MGFAMFRLCAFSILAFLFPIFEMDGNAYAETGRELPKEVTVNGVEFILVPAGWFYKSGGVANNHDPLAEVQYVKVWLDDFYIAKYEARARDFTNFMNKDGKTYASLYSGDKEGCTVRRNDKGEYFSIESDRDLPASFLSWELAIKFSEWMGFRLPTEAEWEKTARGSDDKRIFPWGDNLPDDTYAWFHGSMSCNTIPVHYFPKGVSPYGVYNMAGNVREFVQDWENTEVDSKQHDGMKNPPPAPKPTVTNSNIPAQKIIKGGRWLVEASGLTITHRDLTAPDSSFRCNGTRFAADVDTILKALVKQP